MINFDDLIKWNTKVHNPKWPRIPDHSNTVPIIWGSWSGKTNALLNLINYQREIDKTYLSSRDSF